MLGEKYNSFGMLDHYLFWKAFAKWKYPLSLICFSLVGLLNLLCHPRTSSVCKQMPILISASFFHLLNATPAKPVPKLYFKGFALSMLQAVGKLCYESTT